MTNIFRRRPAVLVGAILLVLIAVAAVLLPYRPIVVAGPLVESVPLVLERPLPGLRLHVFNTGANRMSSLLVGSSPPWRAVPAFVIEHPSQQMILFDLGLSHDVAERGEESIAPPVGWLMESRGRVGFTLEAQMAAAGLSPEEVGSVVISHLHEDHTGVASEFGHAVFYAGIDTRARMFGGGHLPFGNDAAPEWIEIDFGDDVKGAPIGPFDKSFDLFGDGSIILIGGGGHTAEDLMALVNLESGPVLLTGDAVVHHDWLDSDDVERIAVDAERAAVIRNQVRSLRDASAVLIIPGHDLRQLGSGREDLIQHDPQRFKPTAWPIESD